MYSSTSISADHARTGPTGTSFVSGEPSSAFQTPMSSCRSGAMLTGNAAWEVVISEAELLNVRSQRALLGIVINAPA